MESTPVSGVDTKKAIVAGLEAPAWRKPNAAGITPQEHNGKGAPSKAALAMAPNPEPLKCLYKKAVGRKVFIKPPNIKLSGKKPGMGLLTRLHKCWMILCCGW